MLTKYQNFTFKISFESFNQKLIVLKERKNFKPSNPLFIFFADVAKQKNVVRPTTKKKRNMGKMLETLPT